MLALMRLAEIENQKIIKMKTVSMMSHDFQKQNLVTTSKGDLYKCSVCEASGYRDGLAPSIILTESEFVKASKCSFVPKTSGNRPKKVLLDNMPQFGFFYGIYDVVDCPEECADKYSDDVWVYSNFRGEPVRLFSSEYLIIE